MNIATEFYLQAADRLPDTGKHIIGHQTGEDIVVYQAYNNAIADFALKHQSLGGEHFNYDRMSWIKPGFLWMMYRSGWATKENQERILAMWIGKSDFFSMVADAVPTTYKPKQYNGTSEDWKEALKTKDIRVQWDPDHDPFGRALERRAIQLGLKDKTLKLFGKQYIRKIEDITEFVHAQKTLLDKHQLENLLVPEEQVLSAD